MAKRGAAGVGRGAKGSQRGVGAMPAGWMGWDWLQWGCAGQVVCVCVCVAAVCI